MKFFSLSLRFAAVLTLALPLGAAVKEDLVLQAMQDELARSVAQLKIENLEKPYFISYRVQETNSQSVSANFGGTLNRGESHRRRLTVEVRVGSPALDNTNFAGPSSLMQLVGGSGSSLAVDDNYTELRRQIWLATDQAYKQAVETLSKKKAAIQNKTRTDETPDFSAQEPATITDRKTMPPVDLAQAESLVRDLSAVFRELPAVATSSVSLGGGNEITRYINSEGSSFVREEPGITLTVVAGTQADDGFTLDDHCVWIRRQWADLPPKTELIAAMRTLGSRLADLRGAALLEQYNGPVLFEGQAAVELFSQVFAAQMAARKRPVAENPAYERAFAMLENPFLDKIGARVLPDFLSVTDDPTLTKLGDNPLYGDARVDDEGVPTRAVKLIENGRLQTLLVSRSPVRGVLRSTGSQRGAGPLPSNLIVAARDGLDAAALKAELLKIVQQRSKEYGVVIRRMADPVFRIERSAISMPSRDSVRVEPAILAYKVFPDGHEELLRNVEIAGMSVQSFKEILVAGREPYVATIPFRSAATYSTGVVSFAVPALLFEDVTLKKPSGEIPKPQVAKHPFFDK